MHTFVLVPYNFLANDHFDHDGEENSCKSNWLLTDLGPCFSNCFCSFFCRFCDTLSSIQNTIEKQSSIKYSFFHVFSQFCGEFLFRFVKTSFGRKENLAFAFKITCTVIREVFLPSVVLFKQFKHFSFFFIFIKYSFKFVTIIKFNNSVSFIQIIFKFTIVHIFISN